MVDLKMARYIRDAALAEAATIAYVNDGEAAAAVINAHKSNPWTQPTPDELQRILGNSQVGTTEHRVLRKTA